MRKLVLDTNIVLDLFVFGDASVAALRESIANKEVSWVATPVMRDELTRVLSYKLIGARMGTANISLQQVLEAFDAHAMLVEVAAACGVTCRDADDQKFIDLAVAHGATLLSKDKHVLALRRKLATLDVSVAATFQ